jgi:hypothetical protein
MSDGRHRDSEIGVTAAKHIFHSCSLVRVSIVHLLLLGSSFLLFGLNLIELVGLHAITFIVLSRDTSLCPIPNSANGGTYITDPSLRTLF